MESLIWIGTAISLAGLAGIVWCIVAIARARRAGLDDAALRKRLSALVPVNAGALLGSVLGLVLVVAGIFLTR